MRPKIELLAVACIATYFLYLSGGGGLGAGFSHDDLMNMDRAWSAGPAQLARESILFFQPSSNYRTFGGFFYAVCFNAFDLRPEPYRVVILGFLLANLVLTYLAVRYLTQSFELALLAALFHCYHPALSMLYSSTGQCYDVFCFFFYFLALALYFRIRSRGRPPAWYESLLFLVLLILALDSKEMAVTLPLILGLYELIFFPPKRWRALPRWLWREARTAILAAIVVTAFLFGRVYSGRDPLPQMDAYAPALSLKVWASNWSFWLDRLSLRFNETPSLDWAPIVCLLLAAIAFAGARRRHLLFAVLFAVIGAAPVSFISRRDLTAIDIPLAGVALAAAILVSGFVSTLVRLCWGGSLTVTALRPWLLGAVCMALLSDRYLGFSRYQRSYQDPESAQIHAILSEYRQELPRLEAGCRVLVLVDPFQEQFHKHWASLFLLRLVNREPDITVHRLVRLRHPPDAATLAGYQHVITFDRNRLIRVAREHHSDQLRAAALRCPRVRPAGWNDGWDD